MAYVSHFRCLLQPPPPSPLSPSLSLSLNVLKIDGYYFAGLRLRESAPHRVIGFAPVRQRRWGVAGEVAGGRGRIESKESGMDGQGRTRCCL
jgi:hypothetical protein